jgi:hypothetical protein
LKAPQNWGVGGEFISIFSNAEVFDAPTFDETVSDVFVVSDSTEAKATLFNLVDNTPFRYIDAGRLSNARTIERMTLLSGELGQRYGYFPRMNYKLLGETWTPGQRARSPHSINQLRELKTMNDYRLVDCGFHDQLEALATLRQPSHITYTNTNGDRVAIFTQIVDVYAANKADFLKLKDGTEIRLDRLIAVDNKPIRFADNGICEVHHD